MWNVYYLTALSKDFISTLNNLTIHPDLSGTIPIKVISFYIVCVYL